MGTHRARKAGPGVRSTRHNCRTAAPTSDRTSNRSSRTNRGAAGPVVRLDRMIDPTRPDRTSEPHHQQKRRPVPLSLLLPAHGALPPQPGHGKTARLQNDIDGHQRCGRSTHHRSPQRALGQPTHRPQVEPHRSIETINSPFRQNAILSNRSFKYDESGRYSLRLPLSYPHFTTGPTNRTRNLRTPPTPDQAVPVKRAPRFVSP
jgi:hypothetical protein